MSGVVSQLLSAAAQFSGAVSDLVEEAREGAIKTHSNVGSGDTLTIAADGLRLLIEATDSDDNPDAAVNQLHGALIRFLEERP
ncbi:hypothetical protein A8B82_21265 [Sulfitobacter sp. EhC04]|nr:hypothetical protein A8B82_21265 [Sulfitobacter sp. EhC04]